MFPDLCFLGAPLIFWYTSKQNQRKWPH